MADDGVTPRRRGTWRIIGGLLLVLAAIFGIVALISLLTRETTTERVAFPASPLTSIVADLGAGNVRIVAEDREDVEVVIVSRSTFIARPDPTAVLEAGTLRLSGDCRLFFTFSCGVDFEVAVPAGVDLAVEVSASAGNTDIVGLGGTIDADVSAGNITIVDFRGTAAFLAVSAGNVTFSAVTPPVEVRASASAGNVRITVPDDVYRVETDTAAGDATVTVRTDPSSDRVIAAETSAGNIEINVP